MNNMTAIQKAKSKMLVKHCFFASLLLSTEIKPDPGCGTAWTDMRVIGFDPAFIESLKPDVVLFVLAHEIMHIILKHGFRMQGRNAKIWNIACDHAINIQLKKAGLKLWAHCYCDEENFAGMSAEQIYDVLIQEKTTPKGKGGKDKGDQGGLSNDVRAPGDMDQEERAVAERQIDQKVAQAASMARMADDLSDDLERLVNGILNPPLPWQQLLREFMTEATPEDESWNRRNRRFPTIYLPTRWSVRMGEITLIGDTSGSISNQTFAQIGAELAEIVEQVKPERVRMVWADTKVAGEQVFEEGEDIELHPMGGGGTDMRVPLRFVEKYEPLVCVLITDGETPWPDAEPPYPLIVCCTTDEEVPIGRVVRMNP